MSSQRPEVPGHLKAFLEAHPPVLADTPQEAITQENATSDLDRYRLAMRKYDPKVKGLPWAMQAQCPKCGDVVAAEFRKHGDQVVLDISCPTDGHIRQVHHDNLFTSAGDDSKCPHTFSGAKIHPVMTMLPRTVETLCPECACVILGRYYVRDGAVWIEKTCPEHGYFRDCVNRNAKLYSKWAWVSYEETAGLLSPHVKGGKRCPTDCGLCESHQSPVCLANIDLTNRCNLNCPVCFANANAAGYIYEPSFEELAEQMQRIRDYRPIPATCVQFSGGEPTIHPDFIRIVAKAKELGFSNIQIATNGIKMADPEFAQQAAEAGLHTLYLQFDGVDDSVYMKTRNRPLMDKKLAAIDNCRKFNMKVCLVPTIIRGENDDHVAKILKFAVDNIDVVSGISYQPVSFTGRIDVDKLHSQRYTTGDLAQDIAKACGAELYRDFLPLSFAVPFSQMLSTICNAPKIQSSAHPDCAAGTFLWVSPDKKMYPFPQVFDILPLFDALNALYLKVVKKGRSNWLTKVKAAWIFYKYFRRDRAPKDLTFFRMLRSLAGMVNKNTGRGAGSEKNYRTLLAAGMHFQDRYNFDCQRICRCVIQYSTPEGIYPFCTYNCGPMYRPYIEKMHSRPLGQSATAAATAANTSVSAISDNPTDNIAPKIVQPSR
jgi:uncharacterized radical SAM superfamily Fe-S cluster-containing enzyme